MNNELQVLVRDKFYFQKFTTAPDLCLATVSVERCSPFLFVHAI